MQAKLCILFILLGTPHSMALMTPSSRSTPIPHKSLIMDQRLGNDTIPVLEGHGEDNSSIPEVSHSRRHSVLNVQSFLVTTGGNTGRYHQFSGIC